MPLKTVSAEPALHVISSVVCQQIAVNLLDAWTDPKGLSATVRSLLLNEQTDAVSRDASTLDKGNGSDASSEAPKAASEAPSSSSSSSSFTANSIVTSDMTLGIPAHPKSAVPFLTASEAGCLLRRRFRNGSKRTLDLTGYSSSLSSSSARDLSFDLSGRSGGKSGKISSAIGEGELCFCVSVIHAWVATYLQ